MTHASQYAIVIDDQSRALPFADTAEGEWYEAAVRYAYTHGIMQGTSAATFVLNKSLTRAEAVQVLYNLEGQPTVSGTAAFPNLVNDWYKPSIAWANGNQLINGHDDGTLEPGGTTTRAQAASILMRFDQNVVEE